MCWNNFSRNIGVKLIWIQNFGSSIIVLLYFGSGRVWIMLLGLEKVVTSLLFTEDYCSILYLVESGLWRTVWLKWFLWSVWEKIGLLVLNSFMFVPEDMREWVFSGGNIYILYFWIVF